MRTTPYQVIPGRLFPLLAALVVGCSGDRPTAPGTTAPERTSEEGARALPPNGGFTKVPADPPFYARIERPYVAPNDGVHAAIWFYRSPECVPRDFNLLDLLDIPAAFACPMVTTGTEWYQDDAPPFMPPYLSVLQQAPAAPLWIVSWSDLEYAAADDVLTMREILALPSLQRGVATSFYEWLEPFPTRNPSLLLMEANGRLAGGKQFSLRYREDHFAITHFRLRIF